MVAAQRTGLTYVGASDGTAYIHPSVHATIATQLRSFQTIRGPTQGPTAMSSTQAFALGDVDTTVRRTLLDSTMSHAIIRRRTSGLIKTFLTEFASAVTTTQSPGPLDPITSFLGAMTSTSVMVFVVVIVVLAFFVFGTVATRRLKQEMSQKCQFFRPKVQIGAAGGGHGCTID